MAQQSNQSKTSPDRKMKNYQFQKLIKLEKIIGKFSKDMGFDRKDILHLLLGE
jgi:hypothetical protein